MKINEFSVGFGPKLFGFKALKSKKEGDDGVQFSVRALPLGGYGERYFFRHHFFRTCRSTPMSHLSNKALLCNI